jgi:hypothetical protein
VHESSHFINENLIESPAGTVDPLLVPAVTVANGEEGPRGAQSGRRRPTASTWSVRTLRKTADGTGEDITFTTRRSKRIERLSISSSLEPALAPSSALISPEMSLATRWAHTLSILPGDSPVDAFDPWTKYIPTCLGNVSYLDHAAVYHVESVIGGLSRTDVLQKKASAAGQRALEHLRNGIANHNDKKNPRDLLLAILLHRYAEVCLL